MTDGCIWRVVRGAIAACTFVANAATAVDKALELVDHRTKAMIRACKIDSLETKPHTAKTHAELDHFIQEYIDAKQLYPEHFR